MLQNLRAAVFCCRWAHPRKPPDRRPHALDPLIRHLLAQSRPSDMVLASHLNWSQEAAFVTAEWPRVDKRDIPTPIALIAWSSYDSSLDKYHGTD